MSDARAGLLFMTALLAALGAGLTPGCGGGKPDEHAAEEPAAHRDGPHGGTLITVDRRGTRLEILLHAGEVALHFLDADGKTPVAVAGPVRLNVQTPGGPEQVEALPLPGRPGSFAGRHEGFRQPHPVGQIVFSLAGRDYYLPLPEDHHDHGAGEEEGDHGHEHGEGSISVTRWTEQCEWFVELARPERGKAAAFTAHVTLLDRFRPATSGLLAVEAAAGDLKASSPGVGPARPGVFTPTITFPDAGEWTVRLVFSDQDIKETLEWRLRVPETGAAVPEEPEAPGGIVFTKERQWQVPFATGWAASRPQAGGSRELLVPADAVVRKGDRSFLVLQVAGELFRLQAVATEPAGEGLVRVEQGLTGQERIVLKGMEHLPLP